MIFINIDNYIDNNTVFLTDIETVRKTATAIFNDYKSSINSSEPLKFKTIKLCHISSIFFEVLLKEKILYCIDLNRVRQDITIDTSKSVIKRNLTHAINKLYKSAKNIEKSLVEVGDNSNGRVS